MATTTLTLDGDVTTQWDTTTGANHYGEIDEGTTSPSDADYIATTTVNDIDQFTCTATPANTSQVTQVDVNIRGYLDDDSSTARLEVTLWHTTSTQIGSAKYLNGASFSGYGTTPTTASALSWTGLTLTKAQADSLEVRIKFLET
jgi:hypothetical protein